MLPRPAAQNWEQKAFLTTEIENSAEIELGHQRVADMHDR